MAKPGLKITNKDEYKVDFNGVLIIKDGDILIDVSKSDEPEKLKGIKKYFNKLEGQFVNLTLKKVDVEEIVED
jgi:hypothetical protein